MLACVKMTNRLGNMRMRFWAELFKTASNQTGKKYSNLYAYWNSG